MAMDPQKATDPKEHYGKVWKRFKETLRRNTNTPELKELKEIVQYKADVTRTDKRRWQDNTWQEKARKNRLIKTQRKQDKPKQDWTRRSKKRPNKTRQEKAQKQNKEGQNWRVEGRSRQTDKKFISVTRESKRNKSIQHLLYLSRGGGEGAYGHQCLQLGECVLTVHLWQGTGKE